MNQYILFFGDLCLCNVFSFSHRNGLRFIPESEIGLAAIHVNNKTYCNPCCSMQSGGFPYTYIHIRCRWTVLGHYSFILSSLFSVNNEWIMINMMTDCTLKKNIDPYMAATSWLVSWLTRHMNNFSTLPHRIDESEASHCCSNTFSEHGCRWDGTRSAFPEYHSLCGQHWTLSEPEQVEIWALNLAEYLF